MLAEFVHQLRRAGLPVSVTEYLVLLEGLTRHVAAYDVDDFYYFARAAMVKDEKYLDRFDRVFAAYFNGRLELFDQVFGEVPEEWLARQAELLLSEAEKEAIEPPGGWEEMMETLKQRLEEQRERHQGGSKWVGTAGTSPFGAWGYNPQGVRIGQNESRNRSAVKVWDRREFRNLDDSVQLGTRNIQTALRKLRRFAREGAEDELDLEGTIAGTARNAGHLDIRMRPERHNAVKILLFLDVGGSMYPHVRSCEELFSAARSEFKHLEHYYFHNFFYDWVWKDNRRRRSEKTPLAEVMRGYGRDYKVIIVGDASMSPYEITMPGGSVEYWNEEAGEVWARRLLATYPRAVWLNPVPETNWRYVHSVTMVREIMEERMFPLTVEGLDRAIECLKGKNVHAH